MRLSWSQSFGMDPTSIPCRLRPAPAQARRAHFDRHRSESEVHLARGQLPDRVDLRESGLLPPVLDQGSLGSCVSNAGGACPVDRLTGTSLTRNLLAPEWTRFVFEAVLCSPVLVVALAFCISVLYLQSGHSFHWQPCRLPLLGCPKAEDCLIGVSAQPATASAILWPRKVFKHFSPLAYSSTGESLPCS